MAHPHRPYWLWTGTTMTGVSFAFVTVNGALDATRVHFMFWTSIFMILAYAAMAGALLCFVCALRAIPFPLAGDKSRPTSDGERKDLYHIIQLTEAGEKAVNEKRTYVQDSPKQLTAIFRSLTSAQAQRLLEPYYSQWLRVEGEIVDVTEWTGTFLRVVLRKTFRGPAICMVFTNRAVFAERLSVLRAGTRIAATGKIKEISALSITITDCELL